jgi:CRP-like cAMP-binding protein
MCPTHLRSHSKRQLTDCGLCPASRRCWDESIGPASGFFVQRHAEVESGTRLFCQGDRFAGVHIVVSGCVKLLEISTDGTERIVALRLPGELIGIEGWTHGHYPYTAITAGSARLCHLHWPRSKHGTPSAALLERLLRKTAAQLDCSTRVWPSLPAVDRVAVFLTRFAERTGSALALPLTRKEIGSLLGLAEETVVRAIRTLRQRQQLRFEDKRVICLSSNKTASTDSPSPAVAGEG